MSNESQKANAEAEKNKKQQELNTAKNNRLMLLKHMLMQKQKKLKKHKLMRPKPQMMHKKHMTML
jgi:hypothetical protein